MRYLTLVLCLLIASQLNAQTPKCNANISYQYYPYSGRSLNYNLNIHSASHYDSTKQSFHSIDWGDGTKQVGITTVNSTATKLLAYHNYSNPGIYYPVYTQYVIDSNTNIICADTLKDTLQVGTPCKTSISTQYSTADARTITFQASSYPNNNSKKFLWTFGDGSWGVGQTVTHTYTGTNNYNVVLISQDTITKCADTSEVYLVSAVDSNDYCGKNKRIIQSSIQNEYATFHIRNNPNLSIGKSPSESKIVINATFDYGDGQTANISAQKWSHTIAYSQHNYKNTGTYNVRAILEYKTNANTPPFCIDTLYDTVSVSNKATNMTVWGYIKRDSTNHYKPLIPTYKVWLIAYDVTTQTLNAIDSVYARNDIYTMAEFFFQNVPAGVGYLVKAAVVNGPATGTGYVPTYCKSELMWNNAHTLGWVNPSGPSAFYEIYMKNGIVTNGPGFIGGSVLQGANKGTANGIPGMNVFAVDQFGAVVQYSVTDANGKYTINNLPNGTYDIYPENMGFITTPASVTVDAMNNNHTNVSFERSISKKTIIPKTASITTTIENNNTYKIYPNPTTGNISISWNNISNETAYITITDISGKTVYSAEQSMSTTTQINLAHLEAGLYFLTVESNHSNNTQKVIIK